MTTQTVIDTLLTIGNELAGLREQLAERGIQLDGLTENEGKREVYITPPGGWVGKNGDERKAARDVVCMADAEMVIFHDEISKAQRDIKRMAARIAGLEDRRRALEFVARAMDCEA
jgi:hypothetical protein